MIAVSAAALAQPPTPAGLWKTYSDRTGQADGFTPSRRLADRMFQLGLEGDLSIGSRRMGLVLDIGGYYKNVITLAPSLEITTAEIELAALALDQVITRAKQLLR